MGRPVGALLRTRVPPVWHTLVANGFAYGPLVFTGVFLAFQAGAWRGGLVVSTLAAFVLTAVPALVWHRRRAEVQEHESGLLVRRGRATRALLFRDIRSISLRERALVRNGRTSGTLRRLRIRTANGVLSLWDVVDRATTPERT